MELAIASAMFGFVCGIFCAAMMANTCDRDAEKSGVWTHKDRAYRLTRIDNGGSANA